MIKWNDSFRRYHSEQKSRVKQKDSIFLNDAILEKNSQWAMFLHSNPLDDVMLEKSSQWAMFPGSQTGLKMADQNLRLIE